MIKIKSLKITFESLDHFALRSRKIVHDAIKKNKKFIQKNNEMVWSSVETYQQFMNDQKYAILAAIYRYHPQSVYQLAKILNRAQQNVARDCDLLESHGFIKFTTSRLGRKAKSPQLIFDFNAILICLPKVSYKVEFEIAA